MSLLRIMCIACAAIVILSFMPNQGSAQSPRITLIEEATNASCAPCAAQNPTFEHYLAQPARRGKVIPLIWHAYWPGADVMNAADPTMNKSRTDYYSITGVPTAVVNGGAYKGGPADTVSIENAVIAAQGESPITITIVQTDNGADVNGEITVVSADGLSGCVLHVVATEGYHYYDAAGTNGEKEFYYIARKMLPGNAGTTLNLAANESKTVNVSFTKDAEWNSNEIYLVAFVQKTSTKEVLQASESREYLSMEGSALSMYLEKQDNTAHTFSQQFNAPITGPYNLELVNGCPTGWTTDLTINGQPYVDGFSVNLTEGDPVNLNLVITPTGTIRRDGTVELMIKAPRAASGKLTYRYVNHPIDVLMYMRDERGAEVTARYDLAFQYAANWKYALADRGEEVMFNPHDYPIFAMEVGKDILYRPEIDMLKSFISQGGRLWLAGAEIAWALADTGAPALYPNVVPDQEFLNNYLHADYVADDPDPNSTSHAVRGFAGDPIGDGLQMSINQAVKNQDTPDVIKPRDGAEACFYYTKQEDVAGIRYKDNGFVMVYYGFGLEGINNRSWLTNITSRTIIWLLGQTGVEGPNVVPSSISIDAYPNPASTMVTIPVGVDRNAYVSVALYNTYGQRAATVFEGNAAAGYSNFDVPVGNLPAGTYFLRMQSGTSAITKTLSIVR